MSTTKQTTRKRNIKSNVAKVNPIYLNADNFKAVRECAIKLGNDESFVVNSLLKKIDFTPLVKIDNSNDESLKDAVKIKSNVTKANPIYLNTVNLKAVRECAINLGKDESFVVNELLGYIDLIPVIKK